MQGLVSVWRILTPAKRVMLLAAVGATIALFAVLARTASTPGMTLLYAGLDGRTAGQVVAALDRIGVAYEIDGQAILVPSNKRDQARMALAGEGLPGEGQAGYELLDQLNGFTTTSDMFDATYWRAKEGELARTILASPGVRAARVHIAAQNTGPFSRNAAAPTAVVTITTGAARLDPAQAQAIRFLVGSAVPGLVAEQVAVIDSSRGVILSPGDAQDAMTDTKGFVDREQKLESDILNLLEARVGSGNARVQVALDIDMEREATSERIFNPDGRVIAGKETTEVSETTTGSAGAVTVASNLPEGDAGPASAGSRTERTETRETVDYDMSEVTREREKLPGAVKRMSVAVFINQIAAPAAEEGGEPVLRTPEEIETLKNLVAMAAGLNEERGDTVTIQTLPFQPVTTDGTLATANPVMDFLTQHIMQAAQILILAIVTLVLGLFVVKPLLSAKDAPAAEAAPVAASPAPGVQLAGGYDGVLTAQPTDPIATLKEIASSKSDETATLIKAWLETAEDAA